MDWLDEVKRRIKNKNQILFAKDSAFLQDFLWLLQKQDHKTLILWSQDLAAESVARLAEKFPEEKRPQEALEASKDWAAGKIKMRLAQRKILDCHALAKEMTGKEEIAICHAIGQACSVVHTAGHAIGYPMYDLTSIIYRFGMDDCVEAVEHRMQEYLEKLLYWNVHLDKYPKQWAGFLNQ